MRCISRLSLAFVGVLVSGCSTWPLFENFGGQSHHRPKAQVLTAEALSDLSSSGPMVLQNARLIIDNESAFQNKLDLIRNADSEIRLVYYKYNDDISSSVFTNELITATKDRNLKVRVLVDFWNNYERLDFFSYLQKAGEGNIQVRFYGLPTESTLRGALYETSACGGSTTAKTCVLPSEATWFSKLYLTGLYSRNRSMMNLAKQLSGAFAKPIEAKQLNELADEILSLDLSAGVDTVENLSLAVQSAGSPISPLIESSSNGPVFTSGNTRYLQHVTDLSKQRLLVVDGFRFQLGGRDLEDSEDTVNTDFYGESAAALNIQAAYDRVFNFSPMVGDIAQAQSLAPNEYAMNPGPFQKSLALCLLAKKSTAPELESCVDLNLSRMEGFETVATRLEGAENSIKENTENYGKTHTQAIAKSWKTGGDQFETTDLATLKAFYIENLTFTKKDPGVRLYEPETDVASENGKYVHAAWNKALENTCAAAQASKTKKRVIITTESLMLPGELVQTLGKMMSGQWKCHNVDIALITNPTDVASSNPSSLLSRYQLQGLLSFYLFHSREASLKFYEYRSTEQQKNLVKTNLAVFGDDLMIGSADANVRSFTLDTQGAIFVRNAIAATKSYSTYIDRLISSGQLIDLTDYYTTVSAEDLQKESLDVAKTLIPKAEDLNRLNVLGESLTSMTNQILQLSAVSSSSSPRAPATERAPASEEMASPRELLRRNDTVWKTF